MIAHSTDATTPDPMRDAIAEMRYAALRYAELGLSVFPCHTISPDSGACTCGNPDCGREAGKHPANAAGCLAATTARWQIEEWWSCNFPAANIGVACGRPSSVWVLDIDGDTGAQSLAALEQEHDKLPLTLNCRTGSGGLHFYFTLPAQIDIRNSASKIAPGLDIRGTGGYTILPPSRHRSGNRYLWEHLMPPVEAPAWLVALVTAPPPARPANANGQAPPPIDVPAGEVARRVKAYLAHVPPAISGQGGHDQTFAAACSLVLGFGMSIEEALPLMREYSARCVPPWSEQEIRHKLEDVDKQEDLQGRPRGWKLQQGGGGRATISNVRKITDVEGKETQVPVGSSRVDLQACKLEYSIVSPK